MRRGFKAEAERRALQLREQLGATPIDALDLDLTAAALGVPVRSAADFVPVEQLEQLRAIQPDAFSAGTFKLADGGYVVVFNPLHSDARIRSDVAHELAHLLLEHQTRALERVGDFGFFTCNAEQEEEANWLAACLLLPREAMVAAARRRLSIATIAREYKVSEQMARFRLNASGALVQMRRGRSARAARS
jgi:Zn-dependent peptidase ImmA (M78 family)